MVLVVSVAVGAFLRFEGLGHRSLWADEFCTWRVSRMPLAESLRWGPELTKPPLYQLSLRVLTRDPRPSEFVLRTPAAFAGLLAVIAVFWFARTIAGNLVGACAAALMAVNPFLIEFSREARPYSLLLLGAILSTGFWFQLVRWPRARTAVGYVIVTVLAFHAHYLFVLTVAAQVLWMMMIVLVRRALRELLWPTVCVATVGALCLPIVIHYLTHSTSVFQGLSWISRPTLADGVAVLARISYGNYWVFLVFFPCVLGWLAAIRSAARNSVSLWHRLHEGLSDPCWLLWLWVLCAWGGLVVVSFAVHPALIDRYAIPASAPMLLGPLVVLGRWSQQGACAVTAVFVFVGLASWIRHPDVEPGFRELSAYLEESVDRERELVVQVIPPQPAADWLEGERLAFAYYPARGVEIAELHLGEDGVTAQNDILEDPRAMYLVVFQSDPFAILRAAGRTPAHITVNGREYQQLLFTPYRVVKVAARNGS